MSCTCQRCGREYEVDILVSDALWERIRPSGRFGRGGLLCPVCIICAVERMCEYAVFDLVEKTVSLGSKCACASLDEGADQPLCGEEARSDPMCKVCYPDQPDVHLLP